MKPISHFFARNSIEASPRFAEIERPAETKTYRHRLLLKSGSPASVRSLLKAAGHKFTSFFKGKRTVEAAAVCVSVRPIANEPQRKVTLAHDQVVTVHAEVHPPPPVISQSEILAPPMNEAAASTADLSDIFAALRKRIDRPSPTYDRNRFRHFTHYKNTASASRLIGAGFQNHDLGPRSAAAARARALALGDIPARPLEQAVADWHSRADKDAIAAIWLPLAKENPEEAEAFSKFLDKLKGNFSAKSREFQDRVVEWLRQVAASPELRRETFLSAEDASISCMDRIGSVFNEMQGHLVYEKIRQGVFDADTSALVKEMRNEFRKKQLQEIAAKKTQALVESFKKSLGPERLAKLADKTFEIEAILREDFVDEVQIHVALLRKLKDALDLDLGGLEIHYASKLTPADFVEATKTVMEKEDAEFGVWFANSPQWDAMLQRRFPEKHAAFVKARYEGIEAAEKTRKDDVAARIAALNLPDDEDVQAGLGKAIADKVSEDLKQPLTQEILKLDKCRKILDPVWKKEAPAG